MFKLFHPFRLILCVSVLQLYSRWLNFIYSLWLTQFFTDLSGMFRIDLKAKKKLHQLCHPCNQSEKENFRLYVARPHTDNHPQKSNKNTGGNNVLPSPLYLSGSLYRAGRPRALAIPSGVWMPTLLFYHPRRRDRCHGNRDKRPCDWDCRRIRWLFDIMQYYFVFFLIEGFA